MARPYYGAGSDDAMDRFDRGYERIRGFQDEATLRQAGNALRTGNYTGATDALYGAGMIAQAQKLEDRRAADAAARVKATKDAEAELAKFTLDGANRLRQLYDSAAKLPPEQRKARLLSGFDQLVPGFRQRGESDEEIGQIRQRLEADSDTTLTMLGAGAAKAAGYEIVKGSDGSYVAVDTQTGRPVYRFNAPQRFKVGEGESLYETPGSEGPGPDQSSPIAEDVPAPPEPPAVRDLALAAVDEFTKAGARVTSVDVSANRMRRVEVKVPADQAFVALQFKVPRQASFESSPAHDDAVALTVLAGVLDGYSGARLDRALTQGPDRVADSASACRPNLAFASWHMPTQH